MKTLRFRNLFVLRILILLGLPLFVGCNNSDSNPPSILPTGVYQGSCELSGGGGGKGIPICEDFLANLSSNSSSCTNELTRYNNMAISAFYVEPSGLDTDCPLTDPDIPLAGSCGLSDRFIRYYEPAWTTATAQTDCSSRSGNWISA